MHQINHCFIHEVVNIFISTCVHIFIHHERGDELLIRRCHQGEESGNELSGFIREFFEKMLLVIRQCNTCLEEITMVTKQNYCVVPENIHTPPTEGHWKFRGGGGFKGRNF